MGPLLSLTSTLRDAIAQIETVRRGIAIVIADDGQLIGTITDGDIRRAILAGHELDHSVKDIVNRAPLTAPIGTSDAYLTDLLIARGLEAIPLVDSEGVFEKIVHIKDLRPDSEYGSAEGFAAAVIMAGGEGRRLQPLTMAKPKPLIEVGGVPMIERLVRSLVRAGIPQIYIAVNYLAQMIEDYFGSGDAFGAAITYVREKERMGTAGALSLLPRTMEAPFLVINGDVLTGSDYRNLLTFHEEQKSILTVAATDYRVDIPYGVLRTQGARVIAIEEKPSQRFLCNAGIYVLSPEALSYLPKDRPSDMPDLIETVMSKRGSVNVFPIHEYWADVGNAADLERAQEEIKQLDKLNG